MVMMMMMISGEVETSVEQLLSLKPSSQLPLVNPRKKGKQPRYKVMIIIMILMMIMMMRLRCLMLDGDGHAIAFDKPLEKGKQPR